MIAAGEVVERPASVIKELIENAVDAGAHKISVEIRNGGITYMRITDDGCGMLPEDAPTAFLRHATSKISSQEDLGHIATMGFRGEALAAISSVSKIDLLTNTGGPAGGITLRVEAGNVMETAPAGCPQGTTIIVRDLFYNTPARMKFLKRDSVEGGYISGAVQRQALGHPEIAFRFIRDGKQELLTPGDGKLISVIYSVMGRAVAKDMVPVEAKSAGITLTGYAGKPTICRGSRSYQHFFVNGRYVKSPLITAALEEAYKNRMMTGRFPCAVLHLNLSPEAVDVNVHPAKTEVKFLRESDVFDLVHHGVAALLAHTEDRPELLVPEKNDNFFRHMTAGEYRNQTGDSSNINPPAHPIQMPAASRPSAALPFGVTTKVPQTSHLSGVADSATKRPAPLGFSAAEGGKPEKSAPVGSFPVTAKIPEPLREPENKDLTEFHASGVRMKQESSGESEQSVLPMPDLPLPEMPEREPEAPAATATGKTVEAYRIIGEAMNTYIIVEQGNQLLLFDKHAAHERILFERLKKQKREVMSQVLLLPLSAELSAEEISVLSEEKPLLERLGFTLDFQAPDGCLVRSIPCDIDAEEASACLSEIARQLMDGARPDPDAVYDTLLHTIACKAAIKGGWKTDPIEVSHLIAELMSRDDIIHCPHGRPVCITISKQNLEYRFERS